MRQTLSKVVSELKQNPAFTNVVTLPADQRKNLVNTNVIIPGNHFVSLSIEMAENTFQNPMPPKEPKPPSSANHNVKTNPRASRPVPERTGTTAPARDN